jgi:hypothetical protein
MFDITLMEHFYDASFEKDEKVRYAWYLYVLKFLPIVNKQWRDSTSPEKMKFKLPMYKIISISDEALVQWFIILWMPIMNERNAKNWEYEGNVTGKGPHDTKRNINAYSITHTNIEKSRKNKKVAVRWNAIFWEEVQKRNEAMFENKEPSKKKSSSTNTTQYLPLPGLNKDQDYDDDDDSVDEDDDDDSIKKCPPHQV